MLLFTKRRFQEAIQDGRKDIEIRAGSRYRNIKPGDPLVFNHRLRKTVIGVTRTDDRRVFLKFLSPHYKRVGFETRREFREVFKKFYGRNEGPFFAFILGE